MQEPNINLEELKSICSTPVYGQYTTKSPYNYLSGIPKFDNLLDGRKFAETKYQFVLFNYENLIVFKFILENDFNVCNYILEKTHIKDIVLMKNQQIETDTYSDSKSNKLVAVSGLFGIAGAAGALIAGGVSNLKKDKLYIKSKICENGNIYKIILNDKSNSEICITLEEDESFLMKLNDFFIKSINFDFTAKIIKEPITPNKSCYIATMCYGDIDAIEVIEFRKYRDEVLLKSYYGKLFVKIYYSISPKLVKRIYNHSNLNKFIKTNILDKIYNSIKLKNYYNH